MVHDKVVFSKPLPFFRGPGIGTMEVRRFSVCWGLVWGKGFPEAEVLSSPWGWLSRGLSVLGGHMSHKFHHLVAVAKFIVIPGCKFDKVVTEGNANPSI